MGYIKAASFILAKAVLSRHRSALPHVLSGLFSFNIAQDAPPDVDPVILPADTLLSDVLTLLTWMQNSPPSHRLADEILRPHILLLLSLLSYEADLDQPNEEVKSKLFKPDKTIFISLRQLLTVWLERSETSNLVACLQKSLSISSGKSSEPTIPISAFWEVDEAGRPCVKLCRDPNALDEANNTPVQSIKPELVIELLAKEGSRELRAELMLQWLGTLQPSSPPDASPIQAHQSFYLAQAIAEWGPDTLQTPKEILSFVTFALQTNAEAQPTHDDAQERSFEKGLESEMLGADSNTSNSLGETLHYVGLQLLQSLLEG